MESNGIPVRKVYQLLDRCPLGTGKLAEALAKAVPNIQPLARNRCSHFAKRDKAGNLVPDYADLAQCHKVAAKALAEQGLVVIQTVTNNTEGDIVLCTQLLHSSGEWIESNIPIKASPTNPQQVASAITYARRTAYCAIVGMAADDDDDGEAAADASAGGSARARILAIAEQKIREATSPGQRADVLLKVEHHRSQKTISDEDASRLARVASEIDAALQAPPAKSAARGQKREPAPA